MAEVDAARAKARNAVDLGERTLSEANDTLTTLLGTVSYELRLEKTCFFNMQKQTQISFAVTMQLISDFVFAT